MYVRKITSGPRAHVQTSLSTEGCIVQICKFTFLSTSFAMLANPQQSFVNYGILWLEKKAGNMNY